MSAPRSPDGATAASEAASPTDTKSVETFEWLGRWRCDCERCKSAAGAASPDLPCWFVAVDTTAVLLWEALRGRGSVFRWSGADSELGESDPLIKTRYLSVFDRLVDNKHDGYESCYDHLFKISSPDFDQAVLTKALTWSADTKKLVELAHLLVLAVWKMQSPADRPSFLSQSDGFETFSIATITASFRLLVIAMLPVDQKLALLPNFNVEYNGTMALSFGFGTGKHPWIECYLYNFRNVVKTLWLKPAECVANEKFFYPTRSAMSKRAEMQVSVLSRVPRNLTCGVCRSKLSKSKPPAKLFGVEHETCACPKAYPREALQIDRPTETWDQEPDANASKRSVVVVCGLMCLLKVEMTRYPTLYSFVRKCSLAAPAVERGQDKMAAVRDWKEDPRHKAEFEECCSLGRAITPKYFQLFLGTQVPSLIDMLGANRPIPVPAVHLLASGSQREAQRQVVMPLPKTVFTLRDWTPIDSDMSRPWRNEAGNEPLVAYRAAMRKCCGSVDKADSGKKANACLLWMEEWTANFSKFTRNNHEIYIAAELCSGLQRFQPLPPTDATRLLESYFLHAFWAFMPVDSSFVRLRHLREGVKFVVRDHSPELKVLLGDNDYVLVTGRLDLHLTVCDVVILFKEEDSILGVILADGYSFVAETVPLDDLFKSYAAWHASQRNRAHVVELPKLAEGARPEDRTKLGVMYLLSHVLCLLAYGLELPLPWVKKRRLEFKLNVRNRRGGDDGANATATTTVRWTVPAVTDCVADLQLFTRRLGEFGSPFGTFEVFEESKRSSSVPVSSFRIRVKEASGSELSEFVYFGDEKDVFLDETPLSRLSLTVANNLNRSGITFRWLVPQDMPLVRLAESLDKELDPDKEQQGSPSYSWFYRIDDLTLIRMPEAVATSVRDVADFVGIDPVSVRLGLLTDFISEEEMKSLLHPDRRVTDAADFESELFRESDLAAKWAPGLKRAEERPEMPGASQASELSQDKRVKSKGAKKTKSPKPEDSELVLSGTSVGAKPKAIPEQALASKEVRSKLPKSEVSAKIDPAGDDHGAKQLEVPERESAKEQEIASCASSKFKSEAANVTHGDKEEPRKKAKTAEDDQHAINAKKEKKKAKKLNQKSKKAKLNLAHQTVPAESNSSASADAVNNAAAAEAGASSCHDVPAAAKITEQILENLSKTVITGNNSFASADDGDATMSASRNVTAATKMYQFVDDLSETILRVNNSAASTKESTNENVDVAGKICQMAEDLSKTVITENNSFASADDGDATMSTSRNVTAATKVYKFVDDLSETILSENNSAADAVGVKESTSENVDVVGKICQMAEDLTKSNSTKTVRSTSPAVTAAGYSPAPKTCANCSQVAFVLRVCQHCGRVTYFCDEDNCLLADTINHEYDCIVATRKYQEVEGGLCETAFKHGEDAALAEEFSRQNMGASCEMYQMADGSTENNDESEVASVAASGDWPAPPKICASCGRVALVKRMCQHCGVIMHDCGEDICAQEADKTNHEYDCVVARIYRIKELIDRM